MAQAKFTYLAKDANGKDVRGTIEANSKEDAFAQLKGRQLAPSNVSPAVEPAGGLFGVPRKASTAELAMFTRQLATMIGAGIPLLESFEILAEQTKTQNKGFGLGLQETADKVRGGMELSEAMHQFPMIYPEIYINMVKAGEASGALDVILNRMADFLEANEALKSEIKSAMTYPVISLLLIFGITAYLLIGVVPKFEGMFKMLKNKDGTPGQLPAITQYVKAASAFLINHWGLLLGIIAGIVVAYILIMRNPQAQRIRDQIWLKMPVFGPLFQKVALSRFSRTFATLLSSGVPILGALEIVASTSGNRVIEDVLYETRETVKKGEPLSSYLATSWVFPPMVTKMIAIGERSGALEQLLTKISDFYDQQVHATVKSLTSLIEPIMLVVMGTVVGTIVAAIFLPILDLQKSLMNN